MVREKDAGMIPYFQFPAVHLAGPFSLHVFGALVAIGILIGARVTTKRGEALGLPKEDLSNAIFWSVLIGFIFAHAFDLFAYQDGSFGDKLKRLINPFDGISSIGGFLGAFVTLIVFVRMKRQSLLEYCDALAFGLAPGWLFGRLGCFTAHDHPGRFTHFFLGVKYPDAIAAGFPARHDLGLDEAVFALLLTILFYVLSRKKRVAGLYVALFATLYGPVRFGLDFLRATDVGGADPRYAGMTPAQYASIAIFLAGVWLCVRVARSQGSAAGAASTKTDDAADDDEDEAEPSPPVKSTKRLKSDKPAPSRA
jgi:phosphatidylglycerol:prolipoprotein diacylglycerol transferase